MGRFIFMQAPSSLCHLPHQECWDPSDLSDLDDMEEAIDNELWSLSNPQSGDGDGNWGDGGLWSLQHLLQSQALRGWHGDGWWSEPPLLGVSLMGGPLKWSNQKDCWACGFTSGHPSPLTFTWQSITAWVIALWPFWIVIGSAVRQASLLTYVPAPVSRNVACLASSAIRPSPSECLP